MPSEILPSELEARLAAAASLQLLDVREAFEVALAALPHTHHIPLAELPGRLDELDQDKPVVVLCHHGIRSAQAAAYLESRGFHDVANLRGGIDRWSAEVDTGVARY